MFQTWINLKFDFIRQQSHISTSFSYPKVRYRLGSLTAVINSSEGNIWHPTFKINGFCSSCRLWWHKWLCVAPSKKRSDQICMGREAHHSECVQIYTKGVAQKNQLQPYFVRLIIWQERRYIQILLNHSFKKWIWMDFQAFWDS